MADLMTALLCRKEVLVQQISASQNAMNRIPPNFIRYREIQNRIELMETDLKKVNLEIDVQRSQCGLFS